MDMATISLIAMKQLNKIAQEIPVVETIFLVRAIINGIKCAGMILVMIQIIHVEMLMLQKEDFVKIIIVKFFL